MRHVSASAPIPEPVPTAERLNGDGFPVNADSHLTDPHDSSADINYFSNSLTNSLNGFADHTIDNRPEGSLLTSDGSPPAPPHPQPDESPTMVLPVLGAISQWSTTRLIASAAGVVALIVAGLLVLNVLIPDDGKKKPKAAPTPPPSSAPRFTGSVKYQPVNEMCSRIDFASLENTFTPTTTTPTASTAHIVGCKAELDSTAGGGADAGGGAGAGASAGAGAGASSSAKPAQRRTGALELKAEFFPNAKKAQEAYSAHIAEPHMKLLDNIGEKAGTFVTQRDKWANMRLYVLDDNVVFVLTGTASREDRPWTRAEIDELRQQYGRVVRKTLENFQLP